MLYRIRIVAYLSGILQQPCQYERPFVFHGPQKRFAAETARGRDVFYRREGYLPARLNGKHIPQGIGAEDGPAHLRGHTAWSQSFTPVAPGGGSPPIGGFEDGPFFGGGQHASSLRKEVIQ